jgi:hypothetical protein
MEGVAAGRGGLQDLSEKVNSEKNETDIKIPFSF